MTVKKTLDNMKYENMIFEQSYLFFVRITFNITNQTNCLHPVFLAAQYNWPDMMLEQLSYERWKVSWFNYWLPNNGRIKFHSYNIIMTYIYFSSSYSDYTVKNGWMEIKQFPFHRFVLPFEILYWLYTCTGSDQNKH